MKTTLLFMCILLFIQTPKVLSAQSEYNFTTQQEIDDFGENFPNLIYIGGSIYIHGEEIYNLKGLKNIESIDGSLDISACSIESFEGLENLEYIGGSLFVWLCNSLTNFKGLDSLKEVGYLHIENNESQVNFVGLENLHTIGYGTIGYCGSDAFSPENSNLISLDGLEGLRSVNDYLSINFCEVLVDISAIYHLEHVGNRLSINGNESLETCNIDSICLVDCPKINIHGNGEACSYEDPIPSCAQQTSIESANNSGNCSVYYDPAAKLIRTQAVSNSDKRILTIYSIRGEQLLSFKLTNNALDVSMLTPGIYVTEIEDRNNCYREKISIY